jgi:hypothetical protein
MLIVLRAGGKPNRLNPRGRKPRFAPSGSFVGQLEQHIAMAGQGSAPADEVKSAQLVQSIHQVAL